MDSGCSKNGETCPQLLDLIPQESEWHTQTKDGKTQLPSEEKKLELRLGPPGDEDNWSIKATAKNNNSETDEPVISLVYSSSMNSNGKQAHKFPSPEDHNHHPLRSVLSHSWTKSHHHNPQQLTNRPPFLLFPSTPQQSLPVVAKEPSQPCCTKAVNIQNAEKKPFSPTANTAGPPNTSQKRTAPGPVVGWPPIRSFRKNLASSSSSKQAAEQPHKAANEKKAAEPSAKFVKINMDGVPIGRKVDLKAYDSYEKLSAAVDELFRGLLAAQRDPCGGGIVKVEEEKVITGLLDGSGEYTLVYEDNEGDRMLVGDVPWNMFVSTVQRLRVLKSSELSALSLGRSKQGKIPA
ncbi:Auxin-responsive protein IAA18 [Hibiscus syriacus]|uniref:Auxin-responsive protein n=1 Tax=Hibiscus syriacus TaxID=106335 RepID=A0A6A2WW82_HIBSY|nr:auxin-responsive protein IAA26-like [Hibiscus syriacus]KAE8659535.1 Auxin-responsive protein IAA18 [Hibiscus syriacus]